MRPCKSLRPALLALAIVIVPGFAKGQALLEVSIENVRDTLGVVHVALFSNSDNFLKMPVAATTVAAVKGKIIVQFRGVSRGEYAISVIHDANKNGKLDTNLFGIPREGFGFSNDAMGRFGPPAFEKAKLELKKDQTIAITTRYY